MRNRKLAALLAIALLVAVVAACGDDDGDGDGDGGASETTGSTSQPADGEPIKVMALLTTESQAMAFPEAVTGIQARVDAFNAAGGLDGRPIEVDVCNDKFDPNEAAACARHAIDEEVVAVLGFVSVFGDVIAETLEAAGIPYVGNSPISPGDLTSSISFPSGGGIPTHYVGLGSLMVDSGCERIVSTIYDEPAGQAAVGWLKAGIEGSGGTLAESLTAPTGSDFAAAAAGTADADCIAMLMAAIDVGVVLPAVRQANPDTTIGILAASLDQNLLSNFGAELENSIVVDSILPLTSDDPAVQQYLDEMQEFGNEEDQQANSLASWTSTKIFTELLGTIDGDITSTSVLEALNSSDAVDPGPTPVLDFTTPGPRDDVARLFNRSVIVLKVEDGKLVVADDKGFVDITDAFG